MENPVHPLAPIFERVGLKPASEYLWPLLPTNLSRGVIDFQPWFSTLLFDDRSIVYHMVFIRVPVTIPASTPTPPMNGSLKTYLERVVAIARRYKHDVIDETHFFYAILEMFPKETDSIFQFFYDRHCKSHPGQEEKRPFVHSQAIDRVEKYLASSAYPFPDPKDQIRTKKLEFHSGKKIDSRIMSFLQMHRARMNAAERIAKLKITKPAIERHNAEIVV